MTGTLPLINNTPIPLLLISIAGDDSESFVLYHYNGMENSLRPNKLTRFKIFLRFELFIFIYRSLFIYFIIIRSSENVVGQSVGFAGGSGNGNYICPIEEVITASCTYSYF